MLVAKVWHSISSCQLLLQVSVASQEGMADEEGRVNLFRAEGH